MEVPDYDKLIPDENYSSVRLKNFYMIHRRLPWCIRQLDIVDGKLVALSPYYVLDKAFPDELQLTPKISKKLVGIFPEYRDAEPIENAPQVLRDAFYKKALPFSFLPKYYQCNNGIANAKHYRPGRVAFPKMVIIN